MEYYDQLPNLIRLELIQKKEEGSDVAEFESKVANLPADELKQQQLYDELQALPVAQDFPFAEPSDLAGIRNLRPEGPRKLTRDWPEERWKDKFYGAWLGRCAGCALGKPLEYEPFVAGAMGNPGWKNVMLWFQGADAWPIRDYTPGRSRAEELGLRLQPWGSEPSYRENIRYMETDDDLRYTIIGLIMLERKGLNWSTPDIGKLWHEYLDCGEVFTAERQAYVNFHRLFDPAGDIGEEQWQAAKDKVRMHLNPYREWIGAMIRADGWAYGAAGNPELAAELAWRDASFSHVKNGIYGEMFAAAMISAAFVTDDIDEAVEIGLSEIPGTSRLAADVRAAIEIARSSTSQEELVGRIWDRFNHYHWVHTNNNAALVAAALIYARGDFEKAITTAVLGGWDTDCNGATAGSVMGAMLGASRLPQRWTGRFHDTLYAGIKGFNPIAISECANRSYNVFRNIGAQG